MSTSGVAKWKELSVNVPWGKMAAKCWNGASEKTIISVHGWQDNANSFDILIPMLSQDVRFIAMDLPGHGNSSHMPPGNLYEIQRHVMSLHYFVKGLNLTQFSLLGHSLGGGICSLYAGTFPDSIQQLILVDAICAMTSEPDRTVQVFASGIDSFVNEKFKASKVYSTADAAIARMTSAHDSLTEEAARILLERGTRKDDDGYRFLRDPVLQIDTLRLSLIVQLAFISRIKAATLILLADKGLILQWINADTLSKLFDTYKKNTRSFQHHTVPGGHHLHMTEPASIVKYISDFLYANQEKSLTHD